jgi:Eukaryotic initiation factor 4E
MTEVINPATTPSLQLDGNQTDGPVSDENAAPSTSVPAVTNGSNVTVFHDPENFNVKHPLQNQWTLWFTKPPSGKGDNWNDLLKEVVTFDSVEEFWGVYVSHLPSLPCLHPLSNNCFSIEQHSRLLPTRPKIRLPPLQKSRPARMGRRAEQARRQVVLPVQRQARHRHRRIVASRAARCHRRDARGRY